MVRMLGIDVLHDLGLRCPRIDLCLGKVLRASFGINLWSNEDVLLSLRCCLLINKPMQVLDTVETEAQSRCKETTLSAHHSITHVSYTTSQEIDRSRGPYGLSQHH